MDTTHYCFEIKFSSFTHGLCIYLFRGIDYYYYYCFVPYDFILIFFILFFFLIILLLLLLLLECVRYFFINNIEIRNSKNFFFTIFTFLVTANRNFCKHSITRIENLNLQNIYLFKSK